MLRITCLILFITGTVSLAENVLTRNYDNARSGANLNETILTPANVGGLKKLFTVNVDGEVYAQPLYMANLTIEEVTRNVVFVATMNNSVYALNADTGAQLWHVRYGTPVKTTDVQYSKNPNINPSSPTGILSTPVIDPASGILYYDHGEELTSGSTKTYSHHLEAIDIHSGNKLLNSPVTISEPYTTADGTFNFLAKSENQRSSLALASGNIYVMFASHNDQSNGYHGWVYAYSASDLGFVASYMTTTTGVKGGIWQAGSAPAIDTAGNLYISVGNGDYDLSPKGVQQTGESFIKLSPTLTLLDWFTPHDAGSLNSGDMDLGSSGILLVDDEYIVGGGKAGVIYVDNTSNLGKFNSSEDQVLQEFQAVYGRGSSHIHGTPIYFSGKVYVWGENDYLRGFHFSSGLFNTSPFAESSMTAPVTHDNGAMPGGFLSVSANGTTNAIIWASTPYNANATEATVEGVLYALDPNTLKVLWSDKMHDSRDDVGMFAKFVPLTVANGKVYAVNFGPKGTTGAAGQLVVYGLGQ
ncbi:hypothetical protein ACPOL_6856 (plasmid) [Acidisarcina polymorpha]|uniref:Pyrrolo-quinoline quinone repeat domain-containing protein n=1 Tax=Acidisarcina polymorpha TaxID=2211140 RepID=A0A2Z5GBI1_9BACT|nr:PQQ-binding-like beta-propeller repeat protein [Acidisarcina polymorpha]AXC16064.1 hypothetical protein ACPOL_6856 [Acidisarcina polymorpha]